VKRAVQALDHDACRQLADEVCKLTSGAEILKRCEALARAHYEDLF
jgi:hypothetical protein